jgi:hypothetical protein
LGSQQVNAALMVKALPANTGVMYIGNNGSGAVGASTGMPLAAGDAVVFDLVGNLSSLMVDASVSGEGVAWLILEA